MENWGKFLDPQNSILVFSLTTGVDKNITIENENGFQQVKWSRGMMNDELCKMAVIMCLYIKKFDISVEMWIVLQAGAVTPQSASVSASTAVKQQQ